MIWRPIFQHLSPDTIIMSYLERLNDDCLLKCFAQLEGLDDAYSLALVNRACHRVYLRNSDWISRRIIVSKLITLYTLLC